MEFRQNQAIYLQIADHVSERIPSIREMSEDIMVNPNTVMRSYNYLQDLGIIYNQRGIGYFVAEGAFKKTLELKRRNFIRRELPRIFRTMDLLNLTCEDLRTLREENRRSKSAF